MQQAIITRLLADTAVSARVGTRIYPLQRDQGAALPALVVTKISGADDYTMAGPSGLREARVQVDCYSDQTLGAAAHWALANAVRVAMGGLSATVGATRLQGVFLDSERDLVEPDEARPLFRTSLDFIVWAGSAF
jgi:hypothetical protein